MAILKDPPVTTFFDMIMVGLKSALDAKAEEILERKKKELETELEKAKTEVITGYLVNLSEEISYKDLGTQVILTVRKERHE